MSELVSLVDKFGRDNVAVELVDHSLPLDSTYNDTLAAMAEAAGVVTVATNNVDYAHPGRGPLGDGWPRSAPGGRWRRWKSDFPQRTWRLCVPAPSRPNHRHCGVPNTLRPASIHDGSS
ncbi:hypothetical protein P3102_20700 [Amycolatopsis sp. QT-25]|uniref:hypothetical protein n=1 Tax=Amycolatopsis sp. QT-25 TaxID=3034022 RepID=UPI0023EADAD4|nr:hypothetical protein [Amycolatopsis sp. QT-25]WET76546.1 hypothetical protein P3102_20700 [Amycolatopsis sp. QT-25]